MTYGKMKQYRRDRLYNSDRERLMFLQDHLKKSRVIDDQNIYNIGQYYSPNRGKQQND